MKELWKTSTEKDDKPTVIALAALACILQDVLHEGLGHGVTAWLSGAHHLTPSTVALQSDIESRWISANGTLVNLAFGLIFWLLLRNPKRYKPSTAYLFILAMAGNLFTGTGYFLFSGVTNFGDWAAVIDGLQPNWLWRLGLVVLGVASYFGSMRLVAAELALFSGSRANPKRLRLLSWGPYFTDAALAGLAGLSNPFGFFYLIASALPSTLGANAGFLAFPSLVPLWHKGEEEQLGPIQRSKLLIIIAAICALIFAVFLARGISWTR
jgi:hypothetical protein